VVEGFEFGCVCPNCGSSFVAVLTSEDLEDGCTTESVWCSACIDNHVAHLTKSDVEAVLFTGGLIQ
jgi:hypothetical protein